MRQNQPFRVLAIDGGGIRGLYTARLLSILLKYFSRIKDGQKIYLGKKFDLITGTSTGGILALALANEISFDDIIELYKTYGSQIFPYKNRIPTSKIKLIRWLFKFLNKPSANAMILRSALENIFHGLTLDDIYKSHKIALCIPAINASTQKPVVFKTPHKDIYQRDPKRKAVDVCMATSAAPIFFPMAAIPCPDSSIDEVFVDGGLWCNNPVLIGLIEAIDLLEDANREIQIVSVGTCPPPQGQSFTARECYNGLSSWKFGVEALNLSLNAQSAGYKFIADKLIKGLKNSCQIIRLPSSAPPKNDIQHFGLDSAYDEALIALENRAVHDAQHIESLANNQSTDMYTLSTILK